MRAKLLRYGIRLLGPLLLLVVVLRMEQRELMLSAVAKASLWILLAAALLNGANIHLKVIRWQVLLATLGHRYRTGAAWKAILPSMYIGMLTPGRVGDVLRVQYLKHDLKLPYAEGLAVIVMDRFCDLYVLLGFVAIGIAHFAHVLQGDIAYITWGGVVVAAVAPLLFVIKGPADGVLRAVYKRMASGSPDGADQFLRALRAQLGRRLWYTVPLTAGAFLVQYTQGWMASRALGLGLGFADVVGMLAITSLLSLLPISMSGVGVREAFLALAFPSLGLAAEQGVAFGLVVFAVVYLATMSAGFVAWQLAPPPSSSGDPPSGDPASDRK